VLDPDYPLRRARLVLRPYTPSDLDALYDLRSRPEVTRYLYFRPRDRDEVRAALEQKTQAATLADEGGNLAVAVELAATGQVIGDVILFWRSRAHRQGEVGYLFRPDHGGRAMPRRPRA
jgi:RimJ/RimL family protein N-acetyltransferase